MDGEASTDEVGGEKQTSGILMFYHDNPLLVTIRALDWGPQCHMSNLINIFPVAIFTIFLSQCPMSFRLFFVIQ